MNNLRRGCRVVSMKFRAKNRVIQRFFRARLTRLKQNHSKSKMKLYVRNWTVRSNWLCTSKKCSSRTGRLRICSNRHSKRVVSLKISFKLKKMYTNKRCKKCMLNSSSKDQKSLLNASKNAKNTKTKKQTSPSS